MTVNSTLLWVPLVVAGIGLLGTIVGTISGVLITQRRSDRREATARERERVRERELWAREDTVRNFEARRDAYVSFYEALRKMARTAYEHGMGLSEVAAEDQEHELPFEWNQAAFRKLEHCRIYASPEVLAAAITPIALAGAAATRRDTATMTIPSTTARRPTTTPS
jgi:hypothetical protein